MAFDFTDVYDGSEIIVEIGRYETDAWNYTTVAYRRDLNIDVPDNTRNVYDRMSLKGKKRVRSENNLSITQEFRGFDDGLVNFKEENGLVVKVTIQPEDGSTPTTPTKYYTNWCTIPMSIDSIPDSGEFSTTLEGTFDKETDTEPVDGDF
jgi:hypothetical protein